ncbi:MAG TPA: dihydrodipicolinate synthase family protein [Chitinophagaceae bacterium]|nr:dihydrodipicolinate synthase family protein [Chitinophagaceae bacterium]
MATPQWLGVYPAMLTPFKADDSIDFEMFTHNLNAQLDAGIDGVVMGGSLGEASTLLNEEKTALLQHCKKTMNRQVPAIVTVAEQSTRAAIAVAQNAEANGADGLMILPPMRYKADDRETVQYFTSIAASTALPIMIYNNPYDYKIEVTIAMFEELAKIKTIESIKESTRDVSNVTRLKNAFGDRYKILCGVDTLALEELALGADGWVGGLVDAFPAETVAVFRLMKAGRYAEALEIYRWFLPVLELDIHPKLVQYIKLAAAQTGLGTEYVRAPRLVIEGDERKRVLATIQKAIATRPSLPDTIMAAHKKTAALV